MVTSDIIQRVFQVFHNGKTASAYTIEKGSSQYLVSASHVFEGSFEINSIMIRHNHSWKDLPVKTVLNHRDMADTIVFKLQFDLSPRHAVSLGTDGVRFGAWAYFLGFPFGMSTHVGDINTNYPVPFIKAALISGMDLTREGFNTLYLDGHNNKGFSGGPVVCIDESREISTQIIGTISGFLTENPIHSDTQDDIKDHGTNAGIIEAFSIRNILDSI